MVKLVYLIGFFCIQDKCININSITTSMEECAIKARDTIQAIRENDEFGMVFCIDRTRFQKWTHSKEYL